MCTLRLSAPPNRWTIATAPRAARWRAACQRVTAGIAGLPDDRVREGGSFCVREHGGVGRFSGDNAGAVVRDNDEDGFKGPCVWDERQAGQSPPARVRGRYLSFLLRRVSGEIPRQPDTVLGNGFAPRGGRLQPDRSPPEGGRHDSFETLCRDDLHIAAAPRDRPQRPRPMSPLRDGARAPHGDKCSRGAESRAAGHDAPPLDRDSPYGTAPDLGDERHAAGSRDALFDVHEDADAPRPRS